MMSHHSSLPAIIRINFSFFGAACSAALAWLIWPQTAAWWQMGVFSILLAILSASLALRGLLSVWKLILHDLERSRFFRGGREARSDRLADDKAMRKGGMIR